MLELMCNPTVSKGSEFAWVRAEEQGQERGEFMTNGCGCVKDHVCFDFVHIGSVGCPFERRGVVARETLHLVQMC